MGCSTLPLQPSSCSSQAIFLFCTGLRAAINKHGWASSTPREGRAWLEIQLQLETQCHSQSKLLVLHYRCTTGHLEGGKREKRRDMSDCVCLVGKTPRDFTRIAASGGEKLILVLWNINTHITQYNSYITQLRQNITGRVRQKE